MVGHRKRYRHWNPQSYGGLALSPAVWSPMDDMVLFHRDLLPHLDREAFYSSSDLETRGAPPSEAAMLVVVTRSSVLPGVASVPTRRGHTNSEYEFTIHAS